MTPSLTSAARLCREQFRYDGWVAGREECGVIGELGETAHPPFGADLAFARKRLEHLVDGEFETEVPSTSEIAQVEKVIDDRPLTDGWPIDLLNEYFCLHRKVVVQFWGCILRHEVLVGRCKQRMRSSAVFFETNAPFVGAWVEFLINRTL